MLNKTISQQIYFILFPLLAFGLPLYDRLVSILIVALVLNWIVEGNFREKYLRVKNSRPRLILLSFSLLYILYLLGMTYSSNYQYGLFDLEVKLSLLIFPVIFSTLEDQFFQRLKLLRFFYFYIAGCFTITIFVLIRGVLNYTQSNSPLEFYYNNLAAFQHPSYFSMNLNFAVALVIYLLLRNVKEMNFFVKAIFVILIPYFFSFIILLSSKAGIISLLLVFVISISSMIIYRKEYLIGFIFLCMLPFTFMGANYIFPYSFVRFQGVETAFDAEEKDTSKEESSGERVLIWGSSMEIIQEYWFFGVGTGDVKDVLLEKYKKSGNTVAYKRKFNSHNQYLQTFITLGIPGVLVMVGGIAISFLVSLKRKNLLIFQFVTLVAFNLLVESMLERQAGVVFYSFFNSLLLHIQAQEI